MRPRPALATKKACRAWARPWGFAPPAVPGRAAARWKCDRAACASAAIFSAGRPGLAPPPIPPSGPPPASSLAAPPELAESPELDPEIDPDADPDDWRGCQATAGSETPLGGGVAAEVAPPDGRRGPEGEGLSLDGLGGGGGGGAMGGLGDRPAPAPAAARAGPAIRAAPPATADPAPATPAPARAATPPTAIPAVMAAPAPSAGPPVTRAEARFGMNIASMARRIAATRMLSAS